MIANNIFPTNNFLAWATAIRDINPRKYVLVIGSAPGFHQEQGSICWEFDQKIKLKVNLKFM